MQAVLDALSAQQPPIWGPKHKIWTSASLILKTRWGPRYCGLDRKETLGHPMLPRFYNPALRRISNHAVFLQACRR